MFLCIDGKLIDGLIVHLTIHRLYSLYKVNQSELVGIGGQQSQQLSETLNNIKLKIVIRDKNAIHFFKCLNNTF